MTKQEAISLLEGEIIRCRMAPKINGCPMTEEWQMTIDVCQIAIEAIREQEERRWIPVKERLPQKYGEVCKNVNLLMDDGFVTVGWLNQVTNAGYYLDAKNYYVIHEPLSRFTHWMPLPEPLLHAPTVDAVEVVRCKDCIRWNPEIGWCDKHSRFYHGGLDWDMFNDDDFCSYGERRNDG